MDDILKTIDELAGKANPMKWSAHEIYGQNLFRITTPSGPHRGIHVAEDVQQGDAEFIVTIANYWPEISARLKTYKAVMEKCALLADNMQCIQDEDTWYTAFGEIRDELNSALKGRL